MKSLWLRFDKWASEKLGVFYLEKFPVISDRGSRYLIEITQDAYNSGIYIVEVYIEKTKKNGKTKSKSVSGGKYSGRYMMSEWGSFVDMAKNQVRLYEESQAEKRQEEETLQMALEQWSNWDGKIQ
ncbi:hypothetical protein [Paenibacillus xylaniclasticus]|uniref:hypothetical protein n=1 Tax=Paenibacillus xylaniclasticus TaxID=588083 RepID=UPI000FD972C8|nr:MULTISPECIES: hypothetical protein [Paenibacillus]GFN32446.1 hypothetical protein PCURB6_27060 [Paenibacillus curdlanolyticus]